VVDWAAAVAASSGREVSARGQQDAVGARLKRYLACPSDRVFPERDHRGGVVAKGPRALGHSGGRQREHSRAGVVSQDARVPCRPARAELRSVEQGRDDDRRADRAKEVGHVVDLGEVFAHERDNDNPLADVDELHRTAGNLRSLPPADVRMERAAQVVLVDLPFVERPAVVLVLTDADPVVAGREGDVHPGGGGVAGLLRMLPDPDDETGYPVTAQQRLEIVELALVDRALREDDGADAVDFVQGCDERPIDEVEIELFGWNELEEAKGFIGPPVHRALEGPEVRLSYPKRPGQQEEVGALVARLRPRAAAGHLVPSGLDCRALDAGVA